MYENKPIIFKNSAGAEFEAKVLLYEPEIGLTIVDREDENCYLFCSRGPLAPNFVGGEAHLLAHEALVPKIEHMLEAGVFDASVIVGVCQEFGQSGIGDAVSEKRCAFAQ